MGLRLQDEWNSDIRLLTQHVEHAMAPFRPGVVTVWIIEESFPDRELVIKVDCLPEHRFRTVIDFDIQYREEIAYDLARQFCRLFDGIRIEPEANIYLGQE